jgi:hypothetical protein
MTPTRVSIAAAWVAVLTLLVIGLALAQDVKRYAAGA